MSIKLKLCFSVILAGVALKLSIHVVVVIVCCYAIRSNRRHEKVSMSKHSLKKQNWTISVGI